MNYGPDRAPDKHVKLPWELIQEVDAIVTAGLNRRSMVCVLLREALDARQSKVAA